MANSTLTNLFTDIADAIREKNGTSESIPALEFPDRIREISGGGGGSDCLPAPDEYHDYITEAKNLYTGDYAHIAVAESDNILNVAFLMDDFQVLTYDEASTEFTAKGWLYCEYTKSNQTWRVVDYTVQASTGQNYVKHIRYSSMYWEYNGQVIWPVGASGGGDGIKQSEVYDMVVVPKTEMAYTVPRDGTLFMASTYDCSRLGFETQIKKSCVEFRGDLFSGETRSVYVGKKDVVAGEIILIPQITANTLLVLAESGSNVVSSSSSVCRFPCNAAQHTEVNFSGLSRTGGFCYLAIVYSYDNYTIFENEGLNKAAFYPYKTGGIGWGVPGYVTGVSDHFLYKPNSVVSGNNSYLMVTFSLSTSGTPVNDIEADSPADVAVEHTKVFTVGSFSMTSNIDGYMVFVGAYRVPDAFPLSGFTVVAEHTTTVASGPTQIEVIAYKAVTKGEVISWNTTGRAGGTFYRVAKDLSHANIVAGSATKEGTSIAYPLPDSGEHDAMFGVIGFVLSGCYVGNANVSNISTSVEPEAGRLTTFYANRYTAETNESNISFQYAEQEVGEIQGVWAKFTFAE